MSIHDDIFRARARRAHMRSSSEKVERAAELYGVKTLQEKLSENPEFSKMAEFPPFPPKRVAGRPVFTEDPIIQSEIDRDMQLRRNNYLTMKANALAYRRLKPETPLAAIVPAERLAPIPPITSAIEHVDPTYAELRDKDMIIAKKLQAEARAVVVAHAAKKFAEMANEYHKALNPA